ncbi:MAG: deferrochelatase/peroxidase EfeB [Actinobacteria bacterium]|nr:deferrochelatase/peroxidase EfeB [Micrococcales bacterium]MCB9429022.1 deferrochelatase/peroxidase EfeB [Actinomycetota bacterium]MCO5298634.1 iron uptake transporter deferrochelatase/peroxidase subunit [Candidatus Nanopelagicales bacterium]HPE12742.1 iron uptake transporter deferrochelatase/peroxidase subunit [Actinomycetota bacterium]HPJ18974.1 iron uptake transporter deferrochelatase/peroxidase subunit [Actinomycetota bacterium]
MSAVSRRRFLGLIGAGAATAAVGATAAVAVSRDQADALADAVPFFGSHQAGILTPAQDRLHFAAFDLTTERRDDVIRMLRAWTDAAAAMTAGLEVGEFGATAGPYDAPPQDTGEALGLPPSGLTVTIGFGRSLFTDSSGGDRFGLAGHLPAGLIELPTFPGDTLDPARTGGDIYVQACANDPQVAVHAVRNLARLGFGTATVRWSQLGFGRTSSTSAAQATPRNLFGFKDGTANVKAEDPDANTSVWVQPADGPQWMVGGTFGVARRIRMTIETWDRTSLREQEAIFGRTKVDGAPLSGGDEFTEPDFGAMGRDDVPLIAMDSHMRLAHPSRHGGVRMLRRGYNYTDGSDGLGRLDAGLFFLAYQRDVRTSFLPVQQMLARSDTLNEYIRHTGSAVFAVPPGVAEGGYIGQALFEA